MAQKKKKDIIDVSKILRKVLSRKKVFYKTLPVVFVISCFLILCVPRYYTTSISLAPEMENSMGGGTLGSIASSFGFDLGEIQTTDAINPMLYPDLMNDNGFVLKMFNIHVVSADGTIDTDYYTYLKKHQKSPWWTKVKNWIIGLIPKGSSSKAAASGSGNDEIDPYNLSEPDDAIMGAIRGNVKFAVDKKTGVISISVTAQDPLICKTVADSVRSQLQEFITDYRTNKARVDMEYYEQLMDQAKTDYDNSRIAYSQFADANTNLVLNSYRTKLEDMENDMQLKYNTYTTMNTQYQAAKAKVQERTPAFTVIKGANVPITPAGPKKMVFVIGMLFLAVLVDIFYIVKGDIKKSLLQSDEEDE